MIKYLKIVQHRLLVYLTSFTVFSGDIKKRSEKNSENDRFQSCFFFLFFFIPNPKSEKKAGKLTNKRILALLFCLCSRCILDQAGQTIPDEIIVCPQYSMQFFNL